MKLARLATIAALGALCAACPNQADITPMIHVTPGAAARAWLMSRGKAPDAPENIVHPARISILRPGTELGGPNAMGKPGDLLLENDEVAFVIDQLGPGSGFEQGGGNVIDAADAVVRKDELGQIFTFFGDFPRQAVYEKISSSVKDGVGVIVASGKELRDPNLFVTTVYSLRPNDRALLIETTVENRGTNPSGKLGLGDAVQWGAAEKVAPGQPDGFKGPTKTAFIGGVGKSVSYALTSTDGGIEAVNGSSWSDTFQRRDVILQPLEKVHYARVLIVGARPDTSSLVAELTKTAGGKVGSLSLDLVGPGKVKVPAESGVRIALLQKGSEVLTIAPSGTALDAELPPGDYDVAYSGGAGRSSVGPLEHVHIEAAKTAHATLEVTESAKLDLACTSEAGAPMPCKLTFEGLEGTKDPDFGVGSAAGPAKNQVTTATGKVEALPVSPGKYRLTASRGPEYALVQKEITVGPGERGSFSAPLKRVVDTGSYLGCDFHQHSMLGADAPTSTLDRVISNVAEGVDVAVASEHNTVADFMPFVHELHMEGELVEIPGDEITSDAALVPWGHMNVFPLVPDHALPRQGALDPTKPPKEVLDQAAKIPYPHVVQLNHPRAWSIGYLDLAKFDPKTGTAAAPWYDDRFDAIEIWNGRNVESRDKVRADYFSMLLHGHVLTATANTDTHGVVGQEAGYPRTYVRVADAHRPLAWNEQRTSDLVKGILETRDTILTNGPFLKVDVNGAGIGGIATAKNGSIRIHVVVQAAPWVSIDHVGFALASGPTSEKDITAKRNAKGAMEATADFSLVIKKDDAIVVYVKGDKPLTPVLSGAPQEIAPYAMTGAIWIDANGDGVSLGRKKK